MTKLALLIAVLGAGCLGAEPEQHFVLDYEPRTLGVGLEYTFRPMRIVCEPHQEFPYACDQRHATIEAVSAGGAGELRAQQATAFSLFAREPGVAQVDLRANVTEIEPEAQPEHLARTFQVPVLPIAYSQLGWYTSDSITPLDGAAFASSTVSVSQHHYRVPRADLVDALTSEIVAAELDGDAPFALDPGTTSAALATDGGAHASARLSTGDVTGTATVRTSAGGAFMLSIVDESAIARLEATRSLDRIVVHPFDAADRPIHGCPARGPVVADPAGVVRVAEVRPTSWHSYCEIHLAWTGAPTATTIVVQWGGREARVAITPG